MYYPNKREFIRLSKKGNLIPVYREISADFQTPLSAFVKIDDGRHSFLFESVEGEEKIGRYSFLGTAPSLVLESKGSSISIIKGNAKRVNKRSANPFDEIQKIMKDFKSVQVKGLPRFCGGLVGYIGYDTVRFIENIPDTCKDDLKVPDIKFMLADAILVFDKLNHTIKILSNAYLKNKSEKTIRAAYKNAVNKIEAVIKKIEKPLNKKLPEIETSEISLVDFKSNMKKLDFIRSVKKAKDYIKKGDIIQVVLSQRLCAKFNNDPIMAYRALRSINPSPYMFYLSFGKMKLIGSSPEIMVRCEDGIAEIRPIAGTRPRGIDSAEDERLKRELLKDPKERAEHIMLVDLGRNDLGRVCVPGTVKVSEFMTIEKYSHVMHIVSNCVGRLSPKSNIYELLKSSFPAGTVAGAPKIRAMEIIDELEKTKRGPYAGCVGYFSFTGNLDTCITIRTILIKDKTAYVQAGAGIVADSVPEKEYQETINKAKAMLKAIAIAKKI